MTCLVMAAGRSHEGATVPLKFDFAQKMYFKHINENRNFGPQTLKPGSRSRWQQHNHMTLGVTHFPKSHIFDWLLYSSSCTTAGYLLTVNDFRQIPTDISINVRKTLALLHTEIYKSANSG